MSVLSHLESVASEAILGLDENIKISKSITNIKGKLESRFMDQITESVQFGSSTRGTMLPRKMNDRSDVDYMVVFDDDRYQPETYLNWLKEFAKESYPRSICHQSSPAIVLELDHIKFDLVPAIHFVSDMYRIPFSASEACDWIMTDPHSHNKELEWKPKGIAELIILTTRLGKYWNALNEYPVTSFDIESKAISLVCEGSPNLKDYFYRLMSDLYSNSLSDTGKGKVKRALEIIEEVNKFEVYFASKAAEDKIKELIPTP